MFGAGQTERGLPQSPPCLHRLHDRLLRRLNALLTRLCGLRRRSNVFGDASLHVDEIQARLVRLRFPQTRLKDVAGAHVVQFPKGFRRAVTASAEITHLTVDAAAKLPAGVLEGKMRNQWTKLCLPPARHRSRDQGAVLLQLGPITQPDGDQVIELVNVRNQTERDDPRVVRFQHDRGAQEQQARQSSRCDRNVGLNLELSLAS